MDKLAYDGLAIAHKLAMHNVLKGLQSESTAFIRGSWLSIGTKCSPFCSPILINQPVELGSIFEDQPGADWVEPKSTKSDSSSNRQFPTFKNREDALAWLVKD